MTQASGLRAAKKLDTWRALRGAAVDLVTARGFDEVSVEEIAAAARVSKSTLFNYFDSKEALLLDPDPEDPARWRALADARPADEPVWQALCEILVGVTCRDEARLLLRKAMIEQCQAMLEPALAASEPFRGFVREWVGGRIPADPMLVAFVVNSALAVMHTAYRGWRPDEGAPAFERILRDGFAVLGRGLLDLPSAGPV
ncbi:TetR/AcrR family transcriptional regulator [Rhodococcus sp. NPDC058505]|uniref:TetR/AcrR family transcriptional regulator n=1 Tax=unclassified Rhodococcus (in: high G+C Gram-positive bacteria) TaxID=192944 RepID=UPI00365252D8